jgi:hypothetical protein
MTEVAFLFPQRLGTSPHPTLEVSAAWFTRAELDRLLRLYGRMVAAGEWRDYSLSDLPDRAVFSVFRRSREAALYRIEKVPKLAKRQGAFQILTQTGLILHRGQDLDQVLRALERKLFKAVD